MECTLGCGECEKCKDRLMIDKKTCMSARMLAHFVRRVQCTNLD